MAPLLTWTLCIACGLTGGIALVHSLRDYALDQSVARRFREHVSPSLPAPGMRAQLRTLLERFGRRIAGTDSIRQLRDALLQAGYFAPGAAFLFAALRLIATLTAASVLLARPFLKYGTIASGDAAISFFFGFFIYRGFTIFLKLRSESRQRDVRRELPYVLDLLLMVLDSGVSIDQALQHVSQQIGRVAPLTAHMLSQYIADTDDGMPYDKALDRLAQRMAISEGRDFAGLLKQNLFQGGELGQPLRRLAADISEARLSNAREQTGRKAVLLTLIMLAFFMPVLMIAIAAPAVTDVLGTLQHIASDMQGKKK
ncbi:MAG TPA: type II secretion system F family protein [Micropepsaceae bacterium]|jgi:tight adherence protein C